MNAKASVEERELSYEGFPRSQTEFGNAFRNAPRCLYSS